MTDKEDKINSENIYIIKTENYESIRGIRCDN